MMKPFISFFLVVLLAASFTVRDDPFWASYKAKFSKKYLNEADEQRRYEIFNKNMKRAAEYNEIDNLATYGMTPVSDRFPGELLTYTHVPREPTTTSEPLLPPVVGLPDSYNASEEGIVPPIRDQEQCGSCWAFSTMATLSVSNAKLNRVTPLVYSEQQLVDCDTVSNQGCNGGNFDVAFTYLKSKGAMLDEDYPYLGYENKCKYNASKVVTYVKDSSPLSKTYGRAASVDTLKAAIYTYGIISVAIDARKFDVYISGIMNGTGCSNSNINHGVNIIGWGKEGSVEYWIVRNSWGTMWGENGYVRMVTGKNACGIEAYASYAFPPREGSFSSSSPQSSSSHKSSSSHTGESSSNGASIFIPSSLLFLLISLFFLL